MAQVVTRIALALLFAGCMRPVKSARLSTIEPPAPAEEEAAARVSTKRCHVGWGFVFPGLSQLCLRKDREAAALGGLGAAELGTGIAVATANENPDPEIDGPDFGHSGSVIPLLAFQNLYVYGLADGYITEALATRRLYAPRDDLADLAGAPFNLEVMKRPAVWAGILGSLAVGVGASLLISGVDEDRIGQDPVLFGKRLDPEVGYPVGIGVGAGLFTHVAVGEEALFRGLIQSGIARNAGETQGWLYGTLIFGAVHIPNALAFETKEERIDYLLFGIPVITALGGYMGWVYKDADYALGPPAAIHFWYDFLLSATFFALDPEESPLSAGFSIPF